MTALVHTRGDLARLTTHPIAVVMTMGALHEGHAELMRRARTEIGPEGVVVVTDFVNPLQFGAGEDFDRYPRTLDADVALCAEAGVDVVYAPDVAEVYGPGFPDVPRVTIDAGPIGTILEGAARPGHFSGMLTVVGTFLHLTGPDVALFGEKDYQQLVLIRHMVDQLRFPTRVVGVPTVREPDGLAMSSRNRYLSADDRAIAACIPAALRETVRVTAESGAAAGEAAGRALLAEGIDLDYLVVTDEALGAPNPGPGRALIAARVGRTRLIDNLPCTVPA